MTSNADWRPTALANRVRMLVCIVCALMFGIGQTFAHDGHDHGPPPPPLPKTSKPRLTAHSDAYELVGIVNGARLTVFLDRYADNAPVADAKIEILAGSQTVVATAERDGTYSAAVPGLDKPGRFPLVFTITHASGDDLLEGTLEIIAKDGSGENLLGAAVQGPGDANGGGWPIGTFALVGLGALALGIAIGRGTRPQAKAAAAVLSAAILAAGIDPLVAHDGHAPSPAPASENLTGDIPRRLADGSVFLPKPSQRLLSVRTQLAVEGEANRTATLVGRIIPDPNRAGVVQSIGGGRVTGPPGGFVRLGQVVKAGQVLATVVPALPLADQSTLAEKARELEGIVLLAEQKLARLSRLTPGTVGRGQIDDLELEVANARRRLESLREAKISPETLTAPIDGVISVARVVAGQVVQGQDILFQIVDPKAVWVEALAFDQLDPGAIVAATAVTGENRRLTLTFEGRGRALQQQATVLHFAVTDAPANLALGSPVTVLARRPETSIGMLLPRDAVIRGVGGETSVWQHVDPERFVARQVRVEPFDGDQVLITAGIAAKDRIVVHGAELLAQVR